MKQTLNVTGMHCKSCKMLVTDDLEELGAKDIVIDLDEKKKKATVTFDFKGDLKKAIAAIESEGYKVQGTK